MNDKEALEVLQALKEFCRAHDCYKGECPLRNVCNNMWNDAYSLEEAITEALKDE